MGKESKKADAFYRSKGLVSMRLWVPKSIKKRYKVVAKKRGRSVNYVGANVLIRNVP